MPVIDTPAGTLEVTNAILSASEFRATQKISVSNSAPTKNFSVGDKFHVSTTDADAVNITGNLVAQKLKIGNLLVSPTFDLAAVSNVGNTTSNTLQFANATTGFTTTANVEIGGNITLTSNAQVKVGSNVLAEYTGSHGREPKEMPLKKFPEIAFDASKLDGNDTTNTHVQAGYTVTASSSAFEENGFAPWKVFNQDNGKTADNGWHTAGNPAAVSGSPYNTIDSSYVGEWLKIELPKAIKLSHVSIASRNDYASRQPPSKYRVYGSNNDSNWVQLIDADNVVYAEEVFTTKFSTTTNYYKYLALVIQKGTIDTGVTIGEIQYYGTEEPAPPGDLSLDTTLKSTFNSVRSNNYVMYFDGKDPAAGNVPKYLPSGSVKSITPNNVVFDATNNCWTLDGSTESNVTTGSLGLVGDAPHTVSTWINASNLEANATTQQLFSIGSGYSEEIVRVDDTQIAANTWHNVTYAYQGEGGSKVTYVDGRKVEEAQVEDTFGDYPPFAMTGYKTGGYCVSASSDNYNVNGFYSYKAFNKVQGDEGWHGGIGSGTINQALGDVPFPFVANAGGSVYDTSLPGATSSHLSGNFGEWIKLEMPHKLVVGYVTLKARGTSAPGSTQSPKDFKILGSNDDVNWDILESFTSVPYSMTGENHAVGATKGYKYIALLVTRLQRTTVGDVVIGEIQYYGHKEGDLTRFPEPTRVLKYPHVTMTGPAQRGYVASASSKSADDYAPYKAFDNNTSGDNGWTASGTPYSTSNGSYAGGTTYQTTVTGHTPTAVNGEFLQLELTHKINPTKFRITSYTGNGSTGSGRQPKNGVFAGSNDGTNWVLLKSYTNQTSWTQGTFVEITPDTNTSTDYKYIRLIVTDVQSTTDGTVTIHGLEIYGTEEDTGTPAIVGGPFAGKVANFRVYDQYLGDERIQEIYDAQKDEFGHKKSSMTFYKGRVGVGTTEPEGALTVVDEPNAVAKFPKYAVSGNDSYVEGDGRIQLSAADGTGYQAFDGLTSTSWTAKPTRNTRVSEEVDFGAWLKIQTPESMSLKKAEFESNPDWRQVGSDINGSALSDNFGRAVACSHDGTRIIVGGHVHSDNQGMVRVYDWNGTTWELIGNQTLTGTANLDKFGSYVAISGDGNIIAVAAPFEHDGAVSDAGAVRVFYLNGAIWTILPDSGSLTKSYSPFVDAFVGSSVNMFLGNGPPKLSYDGKTIAMCEYGYDISGKNDVGRVLVYKYSNGAWSYKGTGATQFVGDTADAHFGFGMSMSEDGDHLALGTRDAGHFVEVYKWDGSSWNIKGSRLSESGLTGNDDYGPVISISNDGNTLAVGARNADLADGARVDNGGLVFVYHWTGSAWGTPHKLQYNEAADEDFGISVELSGDGKRLIVGASAENSNSGELFTFEYTGTSWIMRTANVSGAGGGTSGLLGYGPDGDAHAVAISRDGSTIVGGELSFNSGFAGAGRVRVFSMPSTIKSIWGSNDDVNWTKITTAPTREEATSNVAGLAFGYDDRLEFKNLDNPNYYKYHAIVADAFTRLKDIKLFGIRNQGSSTLHDGALTLTKNLDVPRIGPPPDADDTPRRDRLVVEYNTSTNPAFGGAVRDTSGRGFDGALYDGSLYSVAEKALRFDGTDDTTEVDLGNKVFKNSSAHTTSLWVKMGKHSSNYQVLFSLGNGLENPDGNLKHVNIFHSTNYGLRVSFTHHDYRLGEVVPVGQWVHVAYTYDGTTWQNSTTPTNVNIYINAVKVAVTSLYQIGGGAGGILDLSTAKLGLGASTDAYLDGGLRNYLLGAISNFKLYDTVLTAQEVKTLYDMGRCSNAIPKTLHIMGGMMRYNNDIGKLQIHNGMRWSTIGGTRATGGTRSTFGDYALHVFTESGTFYVENVEGAYMDILVVAGGGSGGNVTNGGGGGAGGLRLAINKHVTTGSYAVVVGAGGGTNGTGGITGALGSASSWGGYGTSGGGGGGEYGINGSNGGSGGGAGAYSGSTNGGSGQQVNSGDGTFTGYGNNGGNASGTSSNRAGGGGGGAGGAGGTNSGSTPGVGGAGLDLSRTFGTNVGDSGYFASGGHGQNRQDAGRIYKGVPGGGGGRIPVASDADDVNLRSGLPNTGGGGHGGYGGGNGGSGVVIIRYLV